MIKLIAALLSALFLTGCVDQSGNQSADNDTKEKRIVATSVATCEILDKLEVEGVVGVPKTDSYSFRNAMKMQKASVLRWLPIWKS